MTNVAQICKIIKIPEPLEKLPFIEINWCLKKRDLTDHLITQYGEHLSQAEVFPSEYKAYVYPDSIKGKCFIISFD